MTAAEIVNGAQYGLVDELVDGIRYEAAYKIIDGIRSEAAGKIIDGAGMDRMTPDTYDGLNTV